MLSTSAAAPRAAHTLPRAAPASRSCHPVNVNVLSNHRIWRSAGVQRPGLTCTSRLDMPSSRMLPNAASASDGDRITVNVDDLKARTTQVLQDLGYQAGQADEIVKRVVEGLKSDAGSSSTQAGSSAPAAPPGSSSGLHPATQVVHFTRTVQDPYGAVAYPLYQTATFSQPSAVTFGPFDYTRSGNPSRTLLEEQWAALEGGDAAFAFTSGMAAITAVCSLVKSGEHILAGDDIYGGTSRLLGSVLPQQNISVSNVDMTDLKAVEANIQPGKTKLVIVESPTNPRMQICDIAALADLAHKAGAICMVDNSILTCMYQSPLALGADISMTSGTKFIGGHSDVTCGLLAVKGKELAKQVYFLQNAEGAGLAPFDCWLAARGLKTMALRMERAVSNAQELAKFLDAHPLVQRVNYPGLPSSQGYTINAAQSASAGSLLSFTTGDVDVSKALVEAAKIFKITVSFGSVTSLISLPCYMSHASIPAHIRAERGLPDDLVRISVGIEHIDDLKADLQQALDAAAAAAGKAS